jgi:nucleotide-binding universal stress UspA family protein
VFERILVPVELGELDELVMYFLSGLARYGTREVVLIHSARITGVEAAVAVRQEHELGERMDSLAAIVEGAGISVRTILGPNDPLADVMDAAHAESVSLILTGSRGRSAINELTVGSTSEMIGRTSPVPVLMLPFSSLDGSTPQHAARLGENLMKRAVFATDFSDESEKMLDLVKSLDGSVLGCIYIAHVVNPREIREHREARIRMLRRVLAAIRAELETCGVTAQAELGIGQVIDELRETADYLHATCFMIGSRGRTLGEQILLGSVSAHVIRDAGLPVFVTH